jgi:DNA-binding NarL/FixJ family response regulator
VSRLPHTPKSRGCLAYRKPSIKVRRYTSGLPKVVVLHDQAIIPELLKLVLAGRTELVAETRSGKAAVALSELSMPDVVVVAELLVDGVAEYYVPALLQTGARVLLVSEPHDTGRLLELVELGITGIVDTDHSPEELADAVLVLAGGGAVLSPDVVSALAADWRRARRRGPDDLDGAALTSREIEVLGTMSDGLSTKAVAHHLGISIKTVESHKTRIFDKLGVHTQAQAVAIAIGTNTVPFATDQGRATQ